MAWLKKAHFISTFANDLIKFAEGGILQRYEEGEWQDTTQIDLSKDFPYRVKPVEHRLYRYVSEDSSGKVHIEFSRHYERVYSKFIDSGEKGEIEVMNLIEPGNFYRRSSGVLASSVYAWMNDEPLEYRISFTNFWHDLNEEDTSLLDFTRIRAKVLAHDYVLARAFAYKSGDGVKFGSIALYPWQDPEAKYGREIDHFISWAEPNWKRIPV